jgi:hypothetical protein
MTTALDSFRNPPLEITDFGFSPATGVYTATEQDQSDGAFSRLWNRHPDRAFYGHLFVPNASSIAIPSGANTRLTFTGCEVVTFNAGPPVLDRIYITDSGVYLAQIQLQFNAAVTAQVGLIGDTAGTPPNQVFANIGGQAANTTFQINASILYRFWPNLGTDGQFSLGVFINPVAATTLTAADFQLVCLGRLPNILINNP